MNYNQIKNKKQNEKLFRKNHFIFINFIIQNCCFPRKRDEIAINDKIANVPENKNKQRQITLCK